MHTRKHHYHGKTIRRLFLALAFSLLFTSLWQFSDAVYSVHPIVLLIITITVAGYLHRGKRILFMISAVVAIAFVVYFESLAAYYIEHHSPVLAFLMECDMVLMILSAYFSLRTTYYWEGPDGRSDLSFPDIRR